MRSSVLRYLRRSSFVETLMEEWQLQHDEAMFVFDVEEFVSECIDLGNLSKHAWRSFHELLLTDPNAPVIDESGAVMKEALAKTLETFQAVNRLVDEASQKGHAVKDAAEFELVLHETIKISETVADIFAPPDPNMIEESIAAFKRGEYYSIEELIRAAQDGRPLPG